MGIYSLSSKAAADLDQIHEKTFESCASCTKAWTLKGTYSRLIIRARLKVAEALVKELRNGKAHH